MSSAEQGKGMQMPEIAFAHLCLGLPALEAIYPPLGSSRRTLMQASMPEPA